MRADHVHDQPHPKHKGNLACSDGSGLSCGCPLLRRQRQSPPIQALVAFPDHSAHIASLRCSRCIVAQASTSAGLGTGVPVKLQRLRAQSQSNGPGLSAQARPVPACGSALSPQSRYAARGSVPSPASPGADWDQKCHKTAGIWSEILLKGFVKRTFNASVKVQALFTICTEFSSLSTRI